MLVFGDFKILKIFVLKGCRWRVPERSISKFI
jgi:hypothetical protein